MLAEKNRLDMFDVLKGLAIYLVVMGHVLTMCIRGIDAAVSFKLIGEVHMPIFFFISGYFTYKGIRDTGFAVPDLWKRFRQLVIPFFVVGALWMIYFPHSGLRSPLSSSIPQMLTTYWKDGYWFTLTLFELMLLYAGLAWAFSRLPKLGLQLLLSVAVYAGLIAVSPLVSAPDQNYDPIGIGLLTRFFPIFITGVFARKYAGRFRRLALNPWCFVVAAGCFFCCWYYSAYSWEFPGIPQWAVYIAQPFLHLSWMLAVFGIAYRIEDPEAGRKLPDSALKRGLAYLGRNSLAVYLLHYFFLFPLTPLQDPLRMLDLAFVPVTAVAAFFAFFIVLAALGAGYVVGKNKVLSVLLIGK